MNAKMFLYSFLILFSLSVIQAQYNYTEAIRAQLDDPPNLGDDLESYINFPIANQIHARQTELNGIIDYSENATAKPQIMGGDRHTLRNIVIASLNMGFMVKSLKKAGSLNATLASQEEIGNYTQKRIIIHDRYIGRLELLVLVPDVDTGKAVVALHGHGDNPEKFRDDYYGAGLADAGFTVIMPRFRAMNFDATEFNVSRWLAVNGFSLNGLRTYETLLAIRYARQTGYRHIGVLGHSGGSTVAQLAVHIDSDLDALIFDHDHNFIEPADKFHCEYMPGLIRYHDEFYSEDSLRLPSLRLPYGFGGELDKILDFLNLTMGEGKNHKKILIYDENISY